MGEREELLAAVQARLQLVIALQDLSPVLETDAVTEARRLAGTFTDDDGDRQARHLLGWLHWYRYQGLPEGQDREDLQAAMSLFLPCFLADAGELPGPLLPRLAEQAAATVAAWLGQVPGSADPALISDMIGLCQRILDATPADHPDRASYLSNLGGALHTRFEQTGTPADLDTAIEVGHAAVDAAPADDPDRAAYLSNLGNARQTRFRRTGTLADLDTAIEVTRAAVDAAPAGHPNRPMYLSNLGGALQTRFERTGTLADLDTAIEVSHAAVDAAPAGHPNRPMYLSNLGNALHTRFRRAGRQADLDTAIEVGHAAVNGTPAGHPGRPMYLSNLGGALRTRFERSGALADLDTAIEVGHAAVDATPVGHPNRPIYLSSLASARQTRFGRTGEQTDLDTAIEVGHAAVDATPIGHPNRPIYLSNLGNALQTRFGRTGQQADLDTAIQTLRAAVDGAPADDPNRPIYLSNLGNARQTRFGQTGQQADLDTAIQTLRAAVDATPDDHPNRAAYLINLGIARQTRFGRTGAQADLEVTLSVFEQATEVRSAAPSVRIRAARHAAELAALPDPGRAAGMLEAAVLLLPEVAPRQLGRSDQQYAVGRFAGLAGDAAALALSDPAGTSQERATRALRLLEAGRAVLLSQALDTRSDLTDLRQHHPGLAARFASLRDRIDQTPAAETLPLEPAADTGAAPRPDRLADRLAGNRRSLADQLAATLAEIRAQPGFASFALPPATGELLAQAADGPVVTFNISRYRSDALLLTHEGITALDLPGLTRDALTDQVNAFHRALNAAVSPGPSADPTDGQATIREILAWLWDNAAEPVLAALGHGTGPGPCVPWPRVWWATGGLLGLLPLHAAGHHTDPAGPQRRTVLDRVISSYTPTLRALRYARQHALPPAAGLPDAAGQALIVAMPTTPGLGSLPSVRAETAMLRTLLHQPVVLTEPSTPSGNPIAADHIPTRASVLARLPAAAIAHFSCHGDSHPTDPSLSQLLLHDHDSAPLTVASLASVNLDHAQLAYLSACNTAFTATTELLDEAIHLTAAFQLAGFPHVIGTLWAIGDRPAVRIARTFYTRLHTGRGTLDTSHAASALHYAIRKARDAYPDTPSLWAAYLHAGT